MSDDFFIPDPLTPDAPCALTFMALIEAVSKACQGVIDVKMPAGQVSPVPLNYLVVTNSGERKSSSYSIVQRHLQDANKKRGDV